MQIIEFDVFVKTRYVGSMVTDTLCVEVEDNASADEIETIIEECTREWMFDNIDWGFNLK